jgi:hypothetical protein
VGARLFAMFAIFLLSNMDVQKCVTQQARVASLVLQLLTSTTGFIVAEDVEIRAKTPVLQRCIWGKFVKDYQNTPLLRRHLRMMYASFCHLLERIRHLLEVDDDMAALRGGKIIPELHLNATLRHLAGGLYSDICIFCGISVLSFYAILHRTMEAINNTLVIEFPSTWEQCLNLAEKFENVSHQGVIKNCVGAENATQRTYVLILVATTKGMALMYRHAATLIAALPF